MLATCWALLTAASSASQAEFTSSISTPLVAVLVGEVVGWIVGWSVADECQILELAVLPSAHRQGTGRGLLSGLLRRCR